MARIVTVYQATPVALDRQHGRLMPREMAYIRWFRMSEELARLGHQVDMAVPDELATGATREAGFEAPALQQVPISAIRWRDYDVVKTEFHKGFEALERFGGTDHPFIISHLSATVAAEDRDGIAFFGETRSRLYATQTRVERHSRVISLLTPPAGDLWEECFGSRERVIIVPGAADRELPPPTRDPYPHDGQRKILFAGNVYSPHSQPEAHDVVIGKLNRLGRLLGEAGARLYMMGNGDLSRLDQRHVTVLGTLPYPDTWDYFHFADVGVVVVPWGFLHNNESTKIYSYLRAGLPVVSEAGFPNDHVVRESGLGIVAESGDLEGMAQRTLEAAFREWDRQAGIDYVLRNHTWTVRAEIYDRLLRGIAPSFAAAANAETR